MIIAVNLLEAAGLALLLTSLLRCYALARPGRWTGRGYTATDYVRSVDPPATTEKVA